MVINTLVIHGLLKAGTFSLLDSHLQSRQRQLIITNQKAAHMSPAQLESLRREILDLDDSDDGVEGGRGNDESGSADGGYYEESSATPFSDGNKTAKSGVSAKDKRAHRKEQVWGKINQMRTAQGSVKAATSGRSSAQSISSFQHGSSKVTVLPNAGIQSDWRTRLHGPSVEFPTMHTGVAAQRQVRRNREAGERVRGGLTDTDVATSKPQHATMRKSGQPKQVITIIDSDPPEPVGDVVKKPSRAARTQVVPGKSLAVKHLPEWIRDDLDPTRTGRIIATVVDFYGCQQDPWKFDYDDAEVFLTLVQLLIDHLYPEKHFGVSKTDQIYGKARQAVYDVRSKMGKTAITFMIGRAKSLKTVEVQDLVKKALSEGGELYYGDTKQKKDVLQAPGVLTTFAEHLKAIQSSVLAELDFADIFPGVHLQIGYPQGALGLAACAMQRAYVLHETGRFVPTRIGFTEEYVKEGGQESMWANHMGTVRRVYMRKDKTHRFDDLIAKASAYMNSARSVGIAGVSKPQGAKNTTFSIDVMSSPPLFARGNSNLSFDDYDDGFNPLDSDE
ncbi:hypothetical protein BDY19DRAFT_997859 [Irpex rosettiformis]|uniref:Uncharacterized protein n=1 Tax=Irpex rosettiformis TaxID=378272 RepID=A0ACB8TQK6_9APHY|nr:hypothetical protein BDY19DRAFT_997859 [Irpex rosettiformis]